MARLSISLLGLFQVLLHSKEVTGFDSDKARALLAYLALESDRPHRREALAGLLWPERPERDARHSLSQLLFNLRSVLGDRPATRDRAILTLTRQTVQFNRASEHWLDVAAFTALLDDCEQHAHRRLDLCAPCVGLLHQAVDLYRGGFLEGFSLDSSLPFEEWMVLQQERYHRLAVDALHRLARCHEVRDESERALQCARRIVRLEPWREDVHRQVMRILAVTGQRNAALTQYEVCLRALEAELGIEPEEETTALYRSIRDGEKLSPLPDLPLHNLPAPLTPFVGREAELAGIKKHLGDPACRLLTLVGPGGSGKTRLALEAVMDMIYADHGRPFPHGVYFVPLASLRSIEAIVPAIAQSLGFTFQNRGEPREQLLGYLRQKNVLLVLDNFEHLVEGAGITTDILQAAPEIVVLVTSRAGLHVRGEHRFPVSGMSYPGDVSAEDTLQYSAVQLFTTGARLAQPDFELTDDVLPDVVRICQLVEGTPLAILLAAAWVKMLTPAEIVAQLPGHSLDFLESDLRDVPERHTSMRAVFDHSWNLLSERERDIFATLSVFCGGFTRVAAQQVAGAPLRDLVAMADKSLLHRTAAGRYGLHELLRRYTVEKLVQSPDAGRAVRDRHAAYFAAALQRWGRDFKGPRQQEALAEMDIEIDNAQAAWEWAVERRDAKHLSQATEGLRYYYGRRVRRREGKAAFDSAAQALGTVGKPEAGVDGDTLRTLAKVLAFQASFAQALGQTEVAHELLTQGLGLLKRPELADRDTRSEEALLWYFRGSLARRTGRGESRRSFERSLALSQSLGDRWETARVLRALGQLDMESRDYGEAKQKQGESAAICRALGDRRGVAEATRWLSWVYSVEGEVDRGVQLAREGLSIFRDLGDPAGVVSGLTALTSALSWAGEYVESQAQMEECLAIHDDLGMRNAFDLLWLGWVNIHQGRYAQARSHLEAGLALGRAKDQLQMVADALHQLGQVAVPEGRYQEAVELILESITMYQTLGLTDNRGVARCALGYAARGQGDLEQAQRCWVQALRPGMEESSFPLLVYSLPGVALVLLDGGKPEKAMEIYELACRFGAVANSSWFEDVVGVHIAAATATLPPEVVEAAQARGRARDLWATAEELLAELESDSPHPARRNCTPQLKE